jgi:hypothetical protein
MNQQAQANVNWSVTPQQADYILNALGRCPFIEVQGLIKTLIDQANQKPVGPLTGPQEPDVGGYLPAQPNGAMQAPGGPLEAPALT